MTGLRIRSSIQPTGVRVTMDNLMKLVTTALEWSYLAGETEVKAERFKSAAELLVLLHDTFKLIDGAGPETLPKKQNHAEEPGRNGKGPEQQAVSENAVPNEPSTVETAKEQEGTSETANCTFSGVVRIDLQRFTDSGINLVECPGCGRMRSLSPVKGVLRFKAHTTQAADPTDWRAGQPPEKQTGRWLEASCVKRRTRPVRIHGAGRTLKTMAHADHLALHTYRG